MDRKENLVYINKGSIISIKLVRMRENMYYKFVPARYVRRRLFGIIPYGRKDIFVDWHFSYNRFDKIMRDNFSSYSNLIVDELGKRLYYRPYIEITYSGGESIYSKFDTDESAEAYLGYLRSILGSNNLIEIK